ncbi:hypothetical protein BDR06DRAFT_969495 [Suillus hirtellus]|nr:hypothetical protein BDR06DRAFT_969495 [Suillus hirtellus]
MDVNCITAIKQCNVFHNLTHLDINDQLLITEPYTRLEDLQSLTHIIVGLVMGKLMIELVKRLVSSTTLWLNKYGFHNPQVVLLPMQWMSWAKLGQGDMLIWELAEERVRLPQPTEGLASMLFGDREPYLIL